MSDFEWDSDNAYVRYAHALNVRLVAAFHDGSLSCAVDPERTVRFDGECVRQARNDDENRWRAVRPSSRSAMPPSPAAAAAAGGAGDAAAPAVRGVWQWETDKAKVFKNYADDINALIEAHFKTGVSGIRAHFACATLIIGLLCAARFWRAFRCALRRRFQARGGGS